MKTFLVAVAVIGTLFLASAGSAVADDIHLCDNPVGCNNNAMTLTTGGNLYVYGQNKGDGDVYLAVLTPESNTTGEFSGSNSFLSALGTLLNETVTGPSQPTFTAFESNYNGATGLTAGSFDLSLISLGTPNLSENSFLLTGATIPTGDAVLAFILSGTDVTSVSPYSSDFVYGGAVATPEPASILLVGLGLGALGLLKLRHAT